MNPDRGGDPADGSLPPALADYDPLPEEQADEVIGGGSIAEPSAVETPRAAAEAAED